MYSVSTPLPFFAASTEDRNASTTLMDAAESTTDLAAL